MSIFYVQHTEPIIKNLFSFEWQVEEND